MTAPFSVVSVPYLVQGIDSEMGSLLVFSEAGQTPVALAALPGLNECSALCLYLNSYFEDSVNDAWSEGYELGKIQVAPKYQTPSGMVIQGEVLAAESVPA